MFFAWAWSAFTGPSHSAALGTTGLEAFARLFLSWSACFFAANFFSKSAFLSAIDVALARLPCLKDGLNQDRKDERQCLEPKTMKIYSRMPTIWYDKDSRVTHQNPRVQQYIQTYWWLLVSCDNYLSCDSHFCGQVSRQEGLRCTMEVHFLLQNTLNTTFLRSYDALCSTSRILFSPFFLPSNWSHWRLTELIGPVKESCK